MDYKYNRTITELPSSEPELTNPVAVDCTPTCVIMEISAWHMGLAI